MHPGTHARQKWRTLHIWLPDLAARRPSVESSPHPFLSVRLGVRNEERLRTALGIGTMGVMFLGSSFGLTEVNDAFLHMTGFTRQEALGETWQELAPPEFHAASLKTGVEVTTTGEATPFEKQYYRKDGSRW
ncbi:MAG TPA: PAS domain-containing protein [Rubellimicrobium sp.]|nr:PAS domain-containing protein [Rubellimicrobium sp.]